MNHKRTRANIKRKIENKSIYLDSGSPKEETEKEIQKKMKRRQQQKKSRKKNRK